MKNLVEFGLSVKDYDLILVTIPLRQEISKLVLSPEIIASIRRDKDLSTPLIVAKVGKLVEGFSRGDFIYIEPHIELKQLNLSKRSWENPAFITFHEVKTKLLNEVDINKWTNYFEMITGSIIEKEQNKEDIKLEKTPVNLRVGK